MTTSLGEAVARLRSDAKNNLMAFTHAADVETILAELDRLERMRTYWRDKAIYLGYHPKDGEEAETRPPALGELSDAQLVALYSELRHTSKEFCGLPHPMENWAEAHDAAIAKAAREFWGKVDG